MVGPNRLFSLVADLFVVPAQRPNLEHRPIFPWAGHRVTEFLDEIFLGCLSGNGPQRHPSASVELMYLQPHHRRVIAALGKQAGRGRPTRKGGNAAVNRGLGRHPTNFYRSI